MRRKLGIIGGMGSHAASWLFKRIVDLSYGSKDQEYIEIVLHNNTAIPDRTKAIVYAGDSALPELIRSTRLFNDSGIDLAVMACLTAYYYKPQLAVIFNGEFVDPIDLTVEAIQEFCPLTDGLRIGVIASTGALRSGIFQKAMAPLGIEVISLDGKEQEQYFMRPIYMDGGAKSGNISREASDLFFRQVPLLRERGAEMIVGACSEVPLFLSKADIELPYIDVFELLAQKVVDTCYCYS
jgi:aspartate racemase